MIWKLLEEVCTQRLDRNATNFISVQEAPVLNLCHYEIGMPLGRGRFGKVFMGRDRTTKTIFALKIIYKFEIEKSKLKKQVQREIETQYHLDHPNILRLYGYFEDSKRIFLVLEYAARGTLFLMLREAKKFTPVRSALYVHKIALALEFCHQKMIIHRDLKLENILITTDGELKVADFGYAVHCAPSEKRLRICGTLHYMAPELICGLPYDCKVDNWSLGVITYELLTGCSPFDTGIRTTTVENISNCNYAIPPEVPDDAIDLIIQLLEKQHELRISMQGVLQHPWIVAMIEKDSNGDSPNN